MANTPGALARSYGPALGVAMSFAAAVGFGYLGGNWLDNKYGTGFVFTLLGVLLGVATGMKLMYDFAFGKGRQNRADSTNSETSTRKYAPSKEIIDALDEAKKMLADLDTGMIESAGKKKEEE
ncbi:MAG: AtpZ/AtpI family protein [Candidatus Saccharibacteria bacterium]